MGPVQAIKTCLAKSFQFSGRASRPEYWWFAPLGILFPIVGAKGMNGDVIYLSPPVRFVVVILLSIPLISATARRLADVNKARREAVVVFTLCMVLWALYMILRETPDGPQIEQIFTGFFFVTLLIFFVPAIFYSILKVLRNLISSLLLPSQPVQTGQNTVKAQL